MNNFFISLTGDLRGTVQLSSEEVGLEVEAGELAKLFLDQLPLILLLLSVPSCVEAGLFFCKCTAGWVLHDF